MSKKDMIEAIKNQTAATIDNDYIDPKISCCMIVRDEGALIYQAIEHIAPFVDEIIVCDTGSEDNTLTEVERAQKSLTFGDKVILDTGYTWNDDFSEARMYSISKAKHNWIFILDGHELVTGNPNFLKDAIKESAKHNSFPHGYRVKFSDVRNGYEFATAYTNVRLFLKDNMEMKEPIHNQIIVKSHDFIDMGTLRHIGYGSNDPKMIARRDKRNQQTKTLLEKRIKELRATRKSWTDEDKKSYGYMCHQLALLLDGFFHDDEKAGRYYQTALKYQKYYSQDVANNTYSGYARLLARNNKNDEMFKIALEGLNVYKYNVDLCYLIGMRSWELMNHHMSMTFLQNYFHCMALVKQQNETISYHTKDANMAAFTLMIQAMAGGIVLSEKAMNNITVFVEQYTFETRVVLNYMMGTINYEKKVKEDAERNAESNVGQDAGMVRDESGRVSDNDILIEK